MISRKLPISIDIKLFREEQEFGAGVLYQILTGSFCERIRLPAAEERVLKMEKTILLPY
ncbi:MAG: hypothetical protein JRF49_05425 [Deltaproteobacteria bacterium]|nr:hypothetical protein [Deltaproteobacteria bacterium]